MKIRRLELQRELEEGLARHKVAGASVAVFYDGESTTAVAGVTNVNTGVEFTADTLVQLGSITKVFTTTLVMQLVDEGIVDLDEPVLRYLPDLRLGDMNALGRITVKMLLNHTAGIDGDQMADAGHDEETIEKAIARFAQCGQLFAPGAAVSYSNAALVIAGYLVQKLRRTSWYRLVRERIFEPLGMRHSATLPEEALLFRTSVGHRFDAVTKRLAVTSFAFLPLSYGPSNSTLMASAPDLITFARAHMDLGMGPNGVRILSRDSAVAMQRATVKNKGRGYTYLDIGLGWMVADDGLLHHLGGSPGILSALYAYPKNGFAAAILTNSVNSIHLINEMMEPWLEEFGDQTPIGMVKVQVPQERSVSDANRYVGVYEDIANRFEVSQATDGLALSQLTKVVYDGSASTAASDPTPLVPLGNDQFLRGPAETADFFSIFAFINPDASGRMSYLGNSLRLYRRD